MRKTILIGCISSFFLNINVNAEVLISQGNVEVTTEEFITAIDYIVPLNNQKNMRSKEKNMRGFLADYFTIKVMAEESRAKGLDKDPGVQIQQSYYNDRLHTEALINDYYASVKQPDYEVLAKESYLIDSERFNTPEMVKAEHILIVLKDKDDVAALKKVQDLYIRATKGKEVFSELAKAYSEDPSVADNSGDLGFFERKAMVEPFSDAAFALKKGEISKPVKTQFGYHLIHLVDRRKGGKQSFDDVKEQLIAEQVKLFKDDKRNEVVSKFRSSPDIKVNEKVVIEFINKMQQQ